MSKVPKIPLLYVLLYKKLRARCDPVRRGYVPRHKVREAMARTAFGLDMERQVRVLDELQGMVLVKEISRDYIILDMEITVPDV